MTAQQPPVPLTRGERLVVGTCLIVCAVTIVATVGDASYALHNDGPQAVFSGEVHHRYHEPGLGWSELFELHTPTSSRGALELHLAARALGAGPGLAHTIVLDIALLAWLCATFALVLRLCPRRWPMAIAGLATSFQLSFELGVLPFFLACSAGTAIVAFEVGAARPSLLRDTTLAAALYVVARVHVHPAALAGLVVVALRAAGPRPLRGVVGAAAAGLPALTVALATLGGFSGGTSAEPARWATLDGVVSWVRDFLPGDAWRGAVVLALAAASVALLVRERRARPRTELVLGGAAAVLLIAAAVVPEDVGGWQLFRPRLLPFAFVFLLALLPVERWPVRTRMLLACSLLAFGTASALQARASTARWERIFRPVVDALRVAPKQPRTWAALVTVVDEPVPPTRVTPWLHVAQLAAIDLGGRPAYLQDDEPTVHTILARAPSASLASPPFPGLWPKAWDASLDGDRHFEVVRAFAAWGQTVDGLVVYGRPDDRDALWAGGQDVTFALDVAFDRTVYATESVGCALDVLVTGPSEPLTVALGFVPGATALDVALVDGDGGVARFLRAPCGAAWIELDGPPCLGADAGGRLRFDVDRSLQPAALRCERSFAP